MAPVHDPKDPDAFLAHVNTTVETALARGERLEDVITEINAGWRKVSQDNGIDGWPVIRKEGDGWVIDVAGWSKDPDGPDPR